MQFSENEFQENNVSNAQILGIAFVILLIGVAALITLILTPITNLLLQWPVTENWALFIAYTLTYSSVLFVAMKIWRQKTFELHWPNVFTFIIIIPLVLSMLMVSEFLVSLIPMPQKMLDFFNEMIQLNLPGYLTVGIAAPILEELIFRGVILKNFLKKHKPMWAIFWSAFLFGVFHLNPWQFLAAFLIGLIIGWLYYKTKSIWPGIFVHFLNNSISFFMAYHFKDVNSGFTTLIENKMNYTFLLLGAIITGILILLILQKMLNNPKHLQTN